MPTQWQEGLQNSALPCFSPYAWSAKKAAMSIGLYAPLIPVCTVTTTGEAIFHENEQMIVHFVISSNITIRIRIMYGNKFTFIYFLSYRYPTYNFQKPLNWPIYSTCIAQNSRTITLDSLIHWDCGGWNHIDVVFWLTLFKNSTWIQVQVFWVDY